jgi:exopolysaccharide production protein ExoY
MSVASRSSAREISQRDRHRAISATAVVSDRAAVGSNAGLKRKRALDAVLSSLAILTLAPLMLGIAAAIWIFDGRPIFIRHERLGRYGRKFYCLKFRSMARDADQLLTRYLESNPDLRREWAANQKLKHDPRVTPLGAFLRTTSLDELPQFFNVLRGDMSLVGPRPIVEAEVVRYGKAFDRCFSVPPGITGLWQISGRNARSYQERVALDCVYVRRCRTSLDLWILIRTVPAVLSRRGSQ